MIGNISKSKGFKGDRGNLGPQGPQGIQGERGYTPHIEFEYNASTGDLSYTITGYYNADELLVEKEYVTTKDFATTDFVKNLLLSLANQVAQSPAQITLYADRWEQYDGQSMWHQVVYDYDNKIFNIDNAVITANSKVDLQLNAEQIAIFYEKDIAFVTENRGGTVTVYAIGRVPDKDYVIQATVSEVLVNG